MLKRTSVRCPELVAAALLGFSFKIDSKLSRAIVLVYKSKLLTSINGGSSVGFLLKEDSRYFLHQCSCFFYESKLLTSINGGSPPGPPAQDAGDRVALLSTHSFRPPPCVLWPYTPIIYPWLYTYCKLHIAPPTPCQVRGTVQRALWQPCEGIVLER